jgi:hypothetical protein
MKVIFDDRGGPNAPPYPDLLAVNSFSFRRNHAQRTLWVNGYIRNIGNEGFRRSFKVAMGVTYKKWGVTISRQQIFRIETDMPIGREIETPRMQSELRYLDEDPSSRYTFEMIVDIDNEISELKSSNNRYTLEWWFYSPTAVASTEPFTLEPSLNSENEEATS